ncbi:MAG: hypothetical protein CM15mP39_05350 [Synechococcus sp.]|nr:MAG: hypothetical protein CM15mP39_05350 [Synechococcus sp.]
MNALLYVGQTLASPGCGCVSGFSLHQRDTMTAAIEGTGAIPPANAWYRQPITVSKLIDQVEKRWGNGSNAAGWRPRPISRWLHGQALAGPNWIWPNLVRGCEQLNDPSTVVLNPAIVWRAPTGRW